MIMAKFANDSLLAFQKLVQSNNIVERLGPDTRGLALRIGIHSGEVVAGVLRGEKSRCVWLENSSCIRREILTTQAVYTMSYVVV